MNPRRKPCVHTLIPKGHANDDEVSCKLNTKRTVESLTDYEKLDFNTQSSSHWDGLRHYPYSDTKQFYNGVTQEDISGINRSDKIGIQSMLINQSDVKLSLTTLDIAQHPIVTRGVLLDWYAYAIKHNIPHTPFTNQHIPLAQLLEVAREQGTTFRKGDVLLTRTGWTDAYYKLSEEEKDKLGGRDERASIGIEATEESIRWHWEQEFAAVASDTVAYEAWPSPKRWGVCMHEVSIPFMV